MARIKRFFLGLGLAATAVAMAGCRGGLGNLFDVF